MLFSKKIEDLMLEFKFGSMLRVSLCDKNFGKKPNFSRNFFLKSIDSCSSSLIETKSEEFFFKPISSLKFFLRSHPKFFLNQSLNLIDHSHTVLLQ